MKPPLALPLRSVGDTPFVLIRADMLSRLHVWIEWMADTFASEEGPQVPRAVEELGSLGRYIENVVATSPLCFMRGQPVIAEPEMPPEREPGEVGS